MLSMYATALATYKTLSPTTYSLTVNNGDGDGNYVAGAAVTITADAAPAGQQFDQWTGASGVVSSTSPVTTYVMPPMDATVIATYKGLPPTTYSLTVNNSDG